mmetsp:Transcript_3739/g.11054  ORF Transcript_3739/g.11054 Transcript_3739/m.11054 type:complete len:214 (+) Transcript_3739:714-1355(+)
MRRVVKLSSIVLMGPTASGRVHVLSTLAGPINEARRGDTAPELARLTHALWGLDHYPGYLKRWRDDEIGDLEASLEAALAQVRAQRAERRRDEAGVVRTPALDALRDSERWTVADVLVPKLARALGWDASSSVAAALESQSSGRGLWALLREAGDDACGPASRAERRFPDARRGKAKRGAASSTRVEGRPSGTRWTCSRRPSARPCSRPRTRR